MNKIRDFRKKKKISQIELGNLMGVRQTTISEWEKDKKMPNIRKAIKLAKILDTTVEELYKKEN